MFREVLLPLAASLLLTASLDAQSAAAPHSPPTGLSTPPGSIGHRPAPNGAFANGVSRYRGRRMIVSPYFLGDYLPAGPESYEPQRPAEPFPRVINEQPQPEKPPVNAQVIDIPATAALKDSRTPAPVVFILTSGERLESERFLLTSKSLSLSINRQQRVILMDFLDFDATVAANRERGINLHIPADLNEISLGF
jgi:hypothetical protein